MGKKISPRVIRAMQEEEETQTPSPKASLEPPPVVEPLYSSVRCQNCQTLLPLDPPPRKAGESVTCGVCGAVVTVFHPPSPKFIPEQIQGRSAEARRWTITELIFRLIAAAILGGLIGLFVTKCLFG